MIVVHLLGVFAVLYALICIGTLMIAFGITAYDALAYRRRVPTLKE